jgi:HEAT repeat protein/energy-coupling factor transporter ATP-binding protein EcfA2
MRKVKVFISSVIKGYEDRRDATEEAIMELNRDQGFSFEVIRMEPNKHPAVNKSPQKACLDGVKECDTYIGIYPRNNYGWEESSTGISPTHEEFRQSVKDNKCRLVFIENTKETDPKQDVFLKEVGQYVEGHFWNEFESENVDRLKHIVYRALLNLMNANFKDYLPNYLNTLLQRYEGIIRPWEEDIGSFPISEIVQLELQEEGQEEGERKTFTEHDQIERPSERLPKSLLFSDAIKKNQMLLIIGDPGAGKSTSLQWANYSYAEEIRSSQQEPPVPIYLELKWYKNNLLELIVTCFGENGVVCDEETIKDWIKKERFLFLLDGFDEVRDPLKCLSDIKQLMGLSRESSFVVASRKIEHLKDFQSLGFKNAEVKQLSDSQVELFIDKYLGKEKGSELLKELERHNLPNEARNPLILWLMSIEFREKKSQISINKGMLFKNVIECRFLKEWERKVISTEEKAKEIIDAFLKEGRTSYKDLRDEILRQLFASHLLIKVGSQISFWHKSFRDYFAALKLKEIFSNEPKKFLKRYATEGWEESALFFVGIMHVPSDFVERLIQPFWRYFLKSRPLVSFRLFLAAKCIGVNNKIDIETQQRVIEQLTRIIQIWESKSKLRELEPLFFPIYFDARKAFQALGEMKSEKAAEILGEFLENHSDGGFCQWAVMELRNMPLTKKVQDSLLFAALRHNDGVVRVNAQEILRESMTQEIASRLIEIMLAKNEKNVIHVAEFSDKYGLVIKDYPMRIRAIDIMRGYLGEDLKYPDKVIDPLIQIALEEECDDLRTSAAQALGRGHCKDEDSEEKIINNLVQALLENPEADIRANAAYALIYHPSNTNKVAKAFIQALDDKDGKVLRRAAYGLAYIPKTLEEKNEASKKLLKLFSNQDNEVRRNALWTYGIIRKNPNSEEITPLINLLKDENISIRYGAAEALGRLKATSALDALKYMLEDEKYIYPWAYAIWAILQIEPSFSEVIKEKAWEYPYIIQLYDDDIDKRRMAAEVLERIGTEISLPFLNEIYEDHDKRRGVNSVLFRAIRDIKERVKRINL